VAVLNPVKIARGDIPPNRRRGGDLRALLTPTTAGATAGFMGVARLEPGEVITEHYHPYSEEFLYVAAGTLLVRLDGEPQEVAAGEAVLIPRDVRHRLLNAGGTAVEIVFFLSPLAPRPELGHVDTEPYPAAGAGR
jgi:putative monooxygenase